MPNATVNGVTYSAKHVRLFLPTGYQVELQAADYGDSMDKETILNMNGIPIGEVEKAYKADCKFTVGVTDYNKLVAESAAFGGIYGLPAFPVIVSYINNNGLTCTDEITGSIKKSSRKVGKDETWVSQEIELNVVGAIIWNGVPAYTP